MTNEIEVTQADGEMAASIRTALIKACPDMPSYPAGVVEPFLAAHRTRNDAQVKEIRAALDARGLEIRRRTMTDKTQAMDSLIAQDADLLDAEGVKLYWYRQGKDDGVEHERAKIVAWLRGQQTSIEKLRDEMNRHTAGWRFADEHASSLEQSANAIERGEHMQEQSK